MTQLGPGVAHLAPPGFSCEHGSYIVSYCQVYPAETANLDSRHEKKVPLLMGKISLETFVLVAICL